ncbi:ESX secretion-associated protein EspG [Nocardia implantans]|uniref:ESX secretion-associated protein EspG n=1 Tax=Nocardia implantans TaxID=3108168 RepID=A0ABU6ANP3_9NOCA|nr:MULTISPECIES: ESX secretion-associated protein EspG [unclassified Nocardia]MBF6192118.1 ESX secretion-associated protein EspG [Nocardia beijingensis]MEA3530250.1 ESX secretion-associated protein EspG [Nocardia sp. CDC192]MEB3508958.1 ESX secretion-associated protein EspG [Nocardia sp. CDC186]
MTVLGAGRGPSTLDAVVLSLDEMQFLVEKLQIEVPVVLNARARYDNLTDHKAAMDAAAESLAQRDLLIDDVLHGDLENRLRALHRPHWIIALRLVVDGWVSRFCLAKGVDLPVVALRGQDSYVIDEAGNDLPATVLAALGYAEPLELYGMNAPTEELATIFGDTGDAAATAERLAKVGNPAQDAHTLAAALVEIHSYAEIVGVIYGDGTRDTADNHIAVFNTRAGRFIATASRSDDGVKWTSLSSGTPARLRTAVQDLINSLPEREEFPRNPKLS